MKRFAVQSGLATLVVLSLGAAGVTSASATPAASGARQQVIVLLRDQHLVSPTATGSSRTTAVGHDQSVLRSRIGRLGGQTTRSFVTLNAVAATLPASAVTALSTDPDVASVIPDLQWKLTPRSSERATSTRAAASTPAICPTNPSAPQLAPEALELTHTASDSTTDQTARSLGYDGTGVKVGFIADGLDIDQPDFIRADGSHVITDYRDFSGDGTTSSTSGAEAFGDASSIAAQGRTAYDLSTFVNPAHALPAGCTIRVEGIAPGASMVAMKVFSNALLTAPTSTIIQAIDWAVNVDHVDVLNESFGSNPYPDNATDPISIFNRNAVGAGVTVVASSGDAGSGNTLGTASTDPWVIAAGATTSERIYAQEGLYGIQLGNGRYTSNQPSSLSSGGISQTRRVIDLVAPGDLNWALCSDKLLADGTPQYTGCLDNNNNPTNLLDFGGTSESSPFVAGAAALVIQSYRKAHAGASPPPAQVRQILDSSADDLGLPADQQGAGLLNTYRAVQTAASVGVSAKTGQNLLLTRTQTSSVAAPNAKSTTSLDVINEGTSTQRVTAALRSVDTVTAQQSQAVTISATAPTATFLDAFGINRSYVKTTFTVPAGVDRLASVITWDGGGTKIARLTLLDPEGTYAGYSLPQGTGNIGRVELHTPAAGQWTAIIWTGASAAGFSGSVRLVTTDYLSAAAGTVSPSTFSLAPGAHQTLAVTTTAPSIGSSAASLVLTGPSGLKTVGSVVTTAVQPLRRYHTTRFSGSFVTANGRDYSPGQSLTYLLSVPSGAPSLDITVATGATANQIVAHLSDPSGEPISTILNQRSTADGAVVTDPGIQLLHANPQPGIWQLTLELANPVAGTVPQNFDVAVSVEAARIKAAGVPRSTGTVISKQKGSTSSVTIYNTGPAPQTYFIDSRTNTERTYTLVATQSVSAADPFTATIGLPIQTETVPAWLVPTEASRLTVAAKATAPITFDVMPLNSPTALNAPNNPDTESTTGTSPSAVHLAKPVASALWAAFPTLIGPAPADGSATGTTTMQASVRAKTFFTDYTSTTGDPLLATVSATAPAATPVTVPAGGQVTVQLALKPTGSVGSVVSGTVFVDTLQPDALAGTSGYADEYAAVPFTFTIGR